MRLAAEAAPEVVGGQVYNITSGQAVRLTDLLDQLETVLGRPIARRPVPFAAAMAAAGLAELRQTLLNPDTEPRITRHAVAALGLSLTLDISAARRDLGYVPQVLLDEGMRDVIPPVAPLSVPARAAAPRPDLQLLRIGSCLALQGAMRADRSPLPARVPALVAVLTTPDKGVTLFDTGYGSAWRQATATMPEGALRLATPMRLEEALPAALKRIGAGPIDRVILSHLHADHVAGLFDLRQIPPVLASEEALAGLDTLVGGTRLGALAHGLPMPLAGRLAALARSGGLCPLAGSPVPVPELQQGIALTAATDVIVVGLPGHGTGQIGLWLPQGTGGDPRPTLLAADAAYSVAALRDGVPPPQAVLSRLGDPATYLRIFAALSRLVAQGVRVIVSHDPAEAVR